MLLTDARRAARTGPDGDAVPLAEQDRGRWDRGAIAEGVALVTDALAAARRSARTSCRPRSPRCTTRRRSAEETDWPQILALYEILERIAPNPMATLNRAVAVAMVDGPQAGLALLDELDADDRIGDHHRLHAVRAHLLEIAGRHSAAREYYHRAARGTVSLTECRYLETRAARLAPRPASG